MPNTYVFLTNICSPTAPAVCSFDQLDPSDCPSEVLCMHQRSTAHTGANGLTAYI